jgi:hypothetical protein
VVHPDIPDLNFNPADDPQFQEQIDFLMQEPAIMEQDIQMQGLQEDLTQANHQALEQQQEELDLNLSISVPPVSSASSAVQLGSSSGSVQHKGGEDLVEEESVIVLGMPAANHVQPGQPADQEGIQEDLVPAQLPLKVHPVNQEVQGEHEDAIAAHDGLGIPVEILEADQFGLPEFLPALQHPEPMKDHSTPTST